MGILQAIGSGFIGAVAFIYAFRSMLKGVIDIGRKHGGSFLITFADQPFVFSFALLILFALGVGGLVVAWQSLTSDDHER